MSDKKTTSLGLQFAKKNKNKNKTKIGFMAFSFSK